MRGDADCQAIHISRESRQLLLCAVVPIGSSPLPVIMNVHPSLIVSRDIFLQYTSYKWLHNHEMFNKTQQPFLQMFRLLHLDERDPTLLIEPDIDHELMNTPYRLDAP